MAIEPVTPSDLPELARAVAGLLEADAAADMFEDVEAGQIILSALDEAHLDRLLAMVRASISESIRIGPPQARYRERLRHSTVIDHCHTKVAGGSGVFARVVLRFEPTDDDDGLCFDAAVPDGNVPNAYISAIERGVREAAERGSLIGFPIVGLSVTLIDGAFHDIDSTAEAVAVAAGGALREAAQRAGILLLEPVMKLVVLAAHDHREGIEADLRGRTSARIDHVHSERISTIIALVPLADMFGYAARLTALSGDTAQFAMMLDHYAAVPRATHDPDDFRPAHGQRVAAGRALKHRALNQNRSP